MPIYEYECQDCGKRFEEILMVSEDSDPVCQCGSRNAQRKFNAPRVRRGKVWKNTFSVDEDYTQKGVDPSKEYEVLHDKPIGEVNANT